jgi:hypothetical protein
VPRLPVNKHIEAAKEAEANPDKGKEEEVEACEPTSAIGKAWRKFTKAATHGMNVDIHKWTTRGHPQARAHSVSAQAQEGPAPHVET